MDIFNAKMNFVIKVTRTRFSPSVRLALASLILRSRRSKSSLFMISREVHQLNDVTPSREVKKIKKWDNRLEQAPRQSLEYTFAQVSIQKLTM